MPKLTIKKAKKKKLVLSARTQTTKDEENGGLSEARKGSVNIKVGLRRRLFSPQLQTVKIG